MSGNFDWPVEILCAGNLIGKDQRQQIFRSHTLELRRDFTAAAPARNRQRPRGVPAPTNIEHWGAQQRLRQYIADSFRIQIIEDRVERKAVRWSQRQHD